jgi:pimeloyl-ACP methyl ester carboxylesterase
MPIVTVGTRTLHWLESSSDGVGEPPLVLLHGLGGDAGFWAAELAALSAPSPDHRHAAPRRVLALDLRGAGQSLGPLEGITIEDLAGDVVAVLDAANIARADVVGFSMGGLVAQALAVLAPARVRRLVLAAAFPRTNPQARLFLDAVASVYRAGVSPRQMFDLIAPWLFSLSFLADPQHAPYLNYPEDDPNEQPRDTWLALLAAQQAFDGGPQLAAIRAPTLVLAGEQDRLASRCDAEALANGIAGASLCVLPGGHLFNVESPAAFLAAITRHFDA